MAITQGDLLIKRAIELMLEDMRHNEWLLDDVLSDVVSDPFLKDIYGQKEIENAKEWFRNNKIAVVMKWRKDLMEYPCVTIAMGSSQESGQEATLGDQSTEDQQLTPEQINKPVPWIVKPYAGTYTNGYYSFPPNYVAGDAAVGQLLFNKQTGEAYAIDAIDSAGFHIQNTPTLQASTYGIIPQYRYYTSRREQATFEEQYTIGCHVSGEPSTLLWLHAIVLYGLLRYRESLFEARGYQISSLSSTDFVRSQDFDIDRDVAFSRWINMTGKMQNTWLKSPKRTLESVAMAKNPDGSLAPLLIDSNIASNPQVADGTKQDSWQTVEAPLVTKSYTKRNPK